MQLRNNVLKPNKQTPEFLGYSRRMGHFSPILYFHRKTTSLKSNHTIDILSPYITFSYHRINTTSAGIVSVVKGIIIQKSLLYDLKLLTT